MKRRRLTPRQRQEIWDRQVGTCGCGCGAFLESGPVQQEHSIPLALGGPDTLENSMLWLAACHLKKTKLDLARIAKAKRQQLFHETGKSHQHRTRPIQSRGFDKTLRRKMNGETVRVD